MKRICLRMGLPAMAAIVALAAGCSVNTSFMYKPNPSVAGGPKLPVKVAVLPFDDGTEDFTYRGSILFGAVFNRAKSGFTDAFDPILPAQWGKSFADELAASGSFQSVRFLYNPSDLQDEGFIVAGTLKKENYSYFTEGSSIEILVSFRAARRSDQNIVWEKEVGGAWKSPPDVYNKGCALSGQCQADRMNEHWNKLMNGLLAEARNDLVRTLGSLSGGGSEAAGAGTDKPGPPSGESVEQMIDKVLKGK